MSFVEGITAPDGFRLVTGSLEPCRCDPLKPRTWRGLSARDLGLLVKWLLDFAPADVQLYTDVACGVCVELDGTAEPEWLARMAARVSALRIDALVYADGGWSIVECKPSAGYSAMGQILTYAHYGPLRAPCLADARLVVVTDALQEVCRPVYERHGVDVNEVGDVDL